MMTAKEYIRALEVAETHEDVLALWRQAAKPNELSLRDIVAVHKACGRIVFNALTHISLRQESDNEKEE
tara:strand:+ start:102 stop:308 length:207 start_codon:yes stop_codon:yes gene_type:complete